MDDALWLAASAQLRDPNWLTGAVERQRGARGMGGADQGMQEQTGGDQEEGKVDLNVIGDGLSEEACREQLQIVAKQRDTAQRSLDLAEKALATRDQEQAAMARMEAQMACLRTKLGSGDFGSGAA